jgi:DNA-binding transcriptional MerR regulator
MSGNTSDGMNDGSKDGSRDGPTVTDLAAMVGMTPRNIRAYQSRGLLFPPEIHDRKARYSAAHVARLKLIASLQREGFTLASIKRLLEHPDSYASVIDERRRRFRDETGDMPGSVPVSDLTMAAMDPKRRADLIKHGLLWQQQGVMRTHTLLAGMSRTLSDHGVSAELIGELLVEVAQAGSRIGAVLAARVRDAEPGAAGTPSSHERRTDLALLTAQLLATGFEVTCVRAATTSEKSG